MGTQAKSVEAKASTEAKVATHYGRGELEARILAAVAREGKNPDALTALDLAAADEFHVGGLDSTQELAKHMDLSPGLRLLDVGSGIGGPARYFADKHCCEVTGIDLTPEFVEVANNLTRRVKLNHLAGFQLASALQLPFEPASFDRAYMIHVGMNIADKAGIFREVRRVLKPNGLFAIFDFMRMAEKPVRYPVPWAGTEETSFVATPEDYRQDLRDAGFRIAQERPRTAFAIEFTERRIASMPQSELPALGLHLLMGERTPVMIQNILAMMKEGVLEPIELIARAA